MAASGEHAGCEPNGVVRRPPCDYWPVETASSRISVSVSRGVSEGYLVHVDAIVVKRTVDPVRREVIELLRAKTYRQDHAQAVARAITRMLDVN